MRAQDSLIANVDREKQWLGALCKGNDYDFIGALACLNTENTFDHIANKVVFGSFSYETNIDETLKA